MPKPSIEYLNDRSARKPASGGTNYALQGLDRRMIDERARDRDLDPSELTELQCESLWSDYRINAEAMWQGIFERFGLEQGYSLEETF